jgi:hypothetical protein
MDTAYAVPYWLGLMGASQAAEKGMICPERKGRTYLRA